MVPSTSKSRPSSRPSSHCTSSPALSTQKKKHRRATLYDAVAGTKSTPIPPLSLFPPDPHFSLIGRVSTTGFLLPHPIASKNRDTSSSTTIPAPPQNVLFRQRGAPVRYEEDDFYWADRKLADEGIELPDSDLLKAVHVYAAEFYGRRGGQVDFCSLDETALMGVGVLLEEWAEVVLGREGEGVFVEGEILEKMEGRDVEGRDGGEGRDEGEEVEEEKGRERKRRRIDIESGEDDDNGSSSSAH